MENKSGSGNLHSDKKSKRGEKKEVDTFYTRVYDDVIQKNTPVDNMIIEQTCEVGGGRVQSLARVFNSEGDDGKGAASHQAAYTSSLASIHDQRHRAHLRYGDLVTSILQHEADLQSQEERRREGLLLQERQDLESSAQEGEVDRLQELITATRRATAATNAKVTTYSTYKDYVENSVRAWGTEASTVEGVCGRFRDLLTLRFQLLLKVHHAMLRLQQSRRQLLVFVQGEKEREGEALLQLYRERASGWASSRRLGEMEARLAALQTTSTHTHTHLTRVRLAIVNIYCVARAYQRSLPPLGPRASTSTVLKRLHNFLLDAITVTTTARGAIEPASLRPSVGTHKQKKGAAAAAPAGGKDSARRDGGASSRSRRSSASSRSGRESAASKGGEGAAREQPQKGEAEEGEKKPKRQEPKKSLKKAVNLSEAASKMHLLNKPPE